MAIFGWSVREVNAIEVLLSFGLVQILCGLDPCALGTLRLLTAVSARRNIERGRVSGPTSLMAWDRSGPESPDKFWHFCPCLRFFKFRSSTCIHFRTIFEWTRNSEKTHNHQSCLPFANLKEVLWKWFCLLILQAAVRGRLGMGSGLEGISHEKGEGGSRGQKEGEGQGRQGGWGERGGSVERLWEGDVPPPQPFHWAGFGRADLGKLLGLLLWACGFLRGFCRRFASSLFSSLDVSGRAIRITTR